MNALMTTACREWACVSWRHPVGESMIALTLKISILILAISLGISPATAGEGSADIGPQPPYGYFGNEGGRSPPGAYVRPAAYGSPAARAGTKQQGRSRR
jgi:hypothetical protein